MDKTDQWLQFYVKQQSRVAPHVAPTTLVATTKCTPYRLRLHHLQGLPLFQADNCTLKVRAGVTLFDARTNCFFGNTTFTRPVPYDMRKSKGKKGFNVEMDSAIYFQSKADVSEGIHAVVEIVLVQQTDDGVVEGEYSAGWAQVPLQLLQDDPSNLNDISSPSRSKKLNLCDNNLVTNTFGVQYSGQYGTCSVLLHSGSPRYLMLQSALPNQIYQPQPLTAEGAQCRLHFTFDSFPAMEKWQPLIPEHFLTVAQDVIPGLKWEDAITQLPTTRFWGINSALQNAQMCSVHAARLSRMRLQLPEGFLEIVRKLAMAPASPGPSTRIGHSGGSSRGLPYLREIQQCMRIRASVHNGRSFIGPSVWSKPETLEVVEGRRGEHILSMGKITELAWIPGDVMVRIVLELVLVKETSNVIEAIEGTGIVLAWGALQPFQAVTGHGRAALAEGSSQVKLRSGPGHWVRPVAVLDWRRLLEHTNRVDPAAPTLRFDLREAAGMEMWPPCLSASQPSANMPLVHQRSEGVQVQLPSKQPIAERKPFCGDRLSSVPELSRGLAGLNSEVSEAETLITVKEGSAGYQATTKSDTKLLNNTPTPNYKPLTRAETFKIWQIDAHYGEQHPRSGTFLHSVHAPPAVKSITAPGLSSHVKNETIFAGSPSAVDHPGFAVVSQPNTCLHSVKRSMGSSWWCPGSKGRANVRLGDVGTLAATAVPLSHSLSRNIRMHLELADPLVVNEVTVQFLAFSSLLGAENLEDRPLCLARPSMESPGGGRGCIHFTYRLFTQEPTVTSSVKLEPMLGSSTARGSQLYAMLPNEAVIKDGTCSIEHCSGNLTGMAAGVSVQSEIWNSELWDQQLQQLEQHKLENLKQSALQQLQLRAAQYLAQRWLQVDVWDSISLLQVGTFSVPLSGLLRQGEDVAELVYECPIHDQAQMVERETEAATLSSTPLQGTIIVRLINRGRVANQTGQPPATINQQQAAPVVLRTKPALDVAGQVLQDLASLAMVESSSSQSLKEEIMQKAQQKVERILHYRHISPQSEEIDNLGQLVHDQLLADIEQARQRCKSDIILKKLQTELPANVVLCAGFGEVLAFERELCNHSQEESWFELISSTPTQLSLLSDANEWRSLCESARNSGLLIDTDGSATWHAVAAQRFKLAPKQRALLRFKWQSVAQGQSESVQVVNVCMRQVSKGMLTSASPAEQLSHGAAAVLENASAADVQFKVAVLLQPPVIDRTLRFYHAAVPDQGVNVCKVLFNRLPGSSNIAGSTHFISEGSLPVSMLRGPTALHPEGVAFQLPLMQAGKSLCCQLTAMGGASSGALETWEVYVHCLPCLTLCAVVGETVLAEKHISRDVQKPLKLSCHSTCREELEISSRTRILRPGAKGQIQICFTPQAAGVKDALVTVVAGSWRSSPVDMLIIRLDSSSTRISRSFDVTIGQGKSVSKKVSYTNPHQQAHTLSLRTTRPEIVRFSQTELIVGPASSTQVKMTFDPRHAGRGRHNILVFLDNMMDRHVEECFKIVLNVL